MTNRMRAANLLVSVALMGFMANPCKAQTWQDVGHEGTSTDTVMVDTDSIQIEGRFRIVSIMTVYPAARQNSHHVLMDRYVQKTAIDCDNRSFVGIQTQGFLNGKQIGTNAETSDWQNKMVRFKADPFSNRILASACSKPIDEIKTARPD
jgi:hypothetical protein